MAALSSQDDSISICLIRHGQSLAQGTPKQERRMEKYLDCACSTKGIAQAYALPAHIALHGGLEGIELVVSSPLKRALTTALLGFRDRRIGVIRLSSQIVDWRHESDQVFTLLNTFRFQLSCTLACESLGLIYLKIEHARFTKFKRFD